jgi:hypothetical protein
VTDETGTDETGTDETGTDEDEFILDDAPVPAQGIGAAGTLSIEIVPAMALAVGEAYQQQAAIEAA